MSSSRPGSDPVPNSPTSVSVQSAGDVRKIKFCQWCGGPTKHEIPDGEEKLRAICTHCDKIAYQNPKMVVGCLIEHEEKVLLCKRNIQPSHGLLYELGMMSLIMMITPRGRKTRGSINRNGKHGSQNWGKKSTEQFCLATYSYEYNCSLVCVWRFEFCEADEDFDMDYVFRTAFGGARGFSFSFTHEEDEPRWQHRSSRFSKNSKRSWRSRQ